MAGATSDTTCPTDLLSKALETFQADDHKGLSLIEGLLREYPLDPRLHFLRGSVLASLKRYDEARLAMGAAVEISPDYAIARFQLGLLELTSGDANGAQATWAGLATLPSDHPLRLFVSGFDHMVRDEFREAVDRLRQGMAANSENEALNADIRLVIQRLEAEMTADSAEPAPSMTELLLRHSVKRRTTH